MYKKPAEMLVFFAHENRAVQKFVEFFKNLVFILGFLYIILSRRKE